MRFQALCIALQETVGDIFSPALELLGPVDPSKPQTLLTLAPVWVWLIVRALKADTKIPGCLPHRYRKPLAFGLAFAAGCLTKFVAGGTWVQAVMNFAMSASLPVLAHRVFVEKLRSGKEIPLPFLMKPGAPNGAGGVVGSGPLGGDMRRAQRSGIRPPGDRRRPPGSTMMLVFAAALALTPLGCFRSAGPALSKIAAGIDDAQLVLDIVQAAVNVFFAQTPSTKPPEAHAKIQQAIDRSRLAVGVAIRTAHGAEALSDNQTAAAFTNFQKAWTELQALLTEFGVTQPDGTFAATVGGYRAPTIPPPLALSFARSP
jgi:hypothetical protein